MKQNIIITHGTAHRMTESNLIESAPVETSKKGEIVVTGAWKQRSAEEMDLTGGDIEFIRNDLLGRMCYVFADGQRRLPLEAKDVAVDSSSSMAVK